MKGVVMRAAMVAMLILLLPAALFAGPMLGIYFTYGPNQMHYSPVAYEYFNGYVYAQNAGCVLNALEFRVQLTSGITLDADPIYPAGTIDMGSILGGISLAFWPPMDGSYPGYNLIATMPLFAAKWCVESGGTLQDKQVRILPHPDTGLIQGSCFPENELFELAGLTSIICPYMIGTENASWGAIKSLF
jgi:hypothetical protein